MSDRIKAKTTVVASVGFVLFQYQYDLPDPIDSLNPIGNFFRRSHFHKATQRYFDDLVENGRLPDKGDVFELTTAGRSLTIEVLGRQINYQPSDLSLELMRLDEAIKDRRRQRINSQSASH